MSRVAIHDRLLPRLASACECVTKDKVFHNIARLTGCVLISLPLLHGYYTKAAVNHGPYHARQLPSYLVGRYIIILLVDSGTCVCVCVCV